MEQDLKVKGLKQEEKWANAKVQNLKVSKEDAAEAVAEDLKRTKMPRPRRCRRVGIQPDITYFKPAGVPMRKLEESILSVEEFEAIRLKDLKNLDQDNCAKKMDISQPTFHRLILSAREKIADAIVNGKSIKIEGGNYKIKKI